MRALFLLCALFAHAAGAQQQVPLGFEDPHTQHRYQGLLDEIRCLVCQNQSLADSNAELAQDLRVQIHGMIEAGSSDQEILEYLVARYGDFVLYRPPLQGTTLLLWFGPFLLLLAGFVAVYLILRSRNAGEVTLSPDERAALARVMQEQDETERGTAEK